MREMQYVGYGLSVFRAEVFQCMATRIACHLADVMFTLPASGEMAGYVAPERFYEIGSHTGLEELNSYLGRAL